jgi:hypothetical protein
MRFIKLSRHEIPDLQDFFSRELWARKPPGRFDIPKRTPPFVAQNGLEVGEPLVFIYENRVVFTALAESTRTANDGEDQVDWPYHFVIARDSLRPANEELRELERWYNSLAQSDVGLVVRKWNHLDDPDPATQALWIRLRGESNAEVAKDVVENFGTLYQPQEGDLRPLVMQQIRLRQGQARFRDAICRRYGSFCQVTKCGILEILEAAHIHPHRGTRDDDQENGLLLRAEIHTLFDVDLLGIEPETLQVELSATIAAEYGQYGGKRLSCPVGLRPSLSALRERYQRFREFVPAPYQGKKHDAT